MRDLIEWGLDAYRYMVISLEHMNANGQKGVGLGAALARSATTFFIDHAAGSAIEQTFRDIPSNSSTWDLFANQTTPAGAFYYMANPINVAGEAWPPAIEGGEQLVEHTGCTDESDLTVSAIYVVFSGQTPKPGSNPEHIAIEVALLVGNKPQLVNHDLANAIVLSAVHHHPIEALDRLTLEDIDSHPDSSFPTSTRIALCAALFARQGVFDTTPGTAHRKTRRRYERHGWPIPTITLATLPRRHTTSNGSHTNGAYTHRWMVSGHWRNQWYPSTQTHRPIWIAPHIKGPPDTELVAKTRRYVITKPDTSTLAGHP